MSCQDVRGFPHPAAFLVLWKRAVGMDFKGQPQLQAQLPQGHRSFWCLYVLESQVIFEFSPVPFPSLTTEKTVLVGILCAVSTCHGVLADYRKHREVPCDLWVNNGTFVCLSAFKDIWRSTSEKSVFCEHKIAVYLCEHRQIQNITGIFQPGNRK